MYQQSSSKFIKGNHALMTTSQCCFTLISFLYLTILLPLSICRLIAPLETLLVCSSQDIYFCILLHLISVNILWLIYFYIFLHLLLWIPAGIFQPFCAYLREFVWTCVHMFDSYGNFIRQHGNVISPTGIYKLAVGNFSTSYRHFPKSTAYPNWRIDVSVF